MKNHPQKQDDAIRTALRKPVSVDYRGVSLASVLAEIAARHHIRIRIQYKILEDEGISIGDPVTLHANKVTLRSVLHLILEPVGLTTYIADGALWVTTQAEADEERITVVYDVHDLMEDDYSDLIELIENETSGNWFSGEAGTIVEVAEVRAIAIRHAPKVHDEIAALLADLRKTMAGMPKMVKPKVDPQEVVTRTYNMCTEQRAVDWLKVIPRLVAPKTWGDAKDSGVIQKVGTRLIIRHTRAVHRQIGSLLDSYDSPTYSDPRGSIGGSGVGGKSGAGGQKAGTSGKPGKSPKDGTGGGFYSTP